MNINHCLLCGKKISRYYRQDALYCNDLCRKRHFDILNRPEANKRAMELIKDVVEKEVLNVKETNN